METVIGNSPSSYPGLIDYLLVLSLIGLSTYYWYSSRNKKKNDLNANSVKAYSIEPKLNRRIPETDFITKMKSGGRNIIVFYGSQRGTAEEFAVRFAREATRYGMNALVSDPQMCDMDDLSKVGEIPNSMAIFCVATYGEGNPTQNAQEFFSWLQKGGRDLTGLRYAVFGLGNKKYEHYNKTGIYVDARLEELGATRIFELGLGDGDVNMEEDFITWKERFWSSVCQQFGLEEGEDVRWRQYELITHKDMASDQVFHGEVSRLHSFRDQKPPFDAKNPFMSEVIVNRDLYKSSRSCLHIELGLSGSKLKYEAGDHVAVYPENDSSLVEKLGLLLDTDLDQVITLKNLDADSIRKHPFPCPATYRTALQFYTDITRTPRTHVLKELSEYTTNTEHKEFLKRISSLSGEGKHLYSEWIIKDCRSIVHVLEDLPSVKPPLDHLLELLPRLQARIYTINSSPKLYPHSVHITTVVVEYETRTGRLSKGVATNWLKQKVPIDGHKVVIPMSIKTSRLRLPANPKTPIIMIGPGTGLAPFRGFIQERWHLRQEGKDVGPTILYFGCRKKSEDFLYEEELNEYVANGTLTRLYTAFSRDQPNKVYVTHLLKNNMKEIWDVIGLNDGHIYVGGIYGARNMARNVKDIIIEAIQKEAGTTKEAAEIYLVLMEAERRYSTDVWS